MATVNEILQGLLWEQEGTEIDFKKGQYAFDGATDDEKSEILKDILAMANAWRRTAAYILVGVEEIRGGRSIPHGVTNHLGESQLQQFVTSKTNRPVVFSYKIGQIDGASVGVIEIPVQPRPFYLTKPYGRLKPDAVYIRRGSATDIAKPDEIARMSGTTPSAPDVLLVPEIEVEQVTMKQYRVKVFAKNEGTASPKNFRVDIEVPDDFAVPTVNFEREVRHADGYRYCQTGSGYFPDGIFEVTAS